MKPEIIGQKYDKVAEWWENRHMDSDYGLDQIGRAVRYCANRRKALDVGCGSGGRIISLLLSEGFEVTGIDVSEKMLGLAKKNHPGVKFVKSDFCVWESSEKFDLIVAWDSIFHLPSVQQEGAVKKLCGHLEKDGVLIYSIGDDHGDHEDLSFRDENGGQAGELDNDMFGYGAIGIDGNLKALGSCGCKVMHLELDMYPEKHVFVIAKK